MNTTNPRFILRNYIAQNAIDAAEKGDFSEVRRVLEILQTPYSEDLDLESLTQTTADTSLTAATEDTSSSVESRTFVGQCYDGKPPSWSTDLRVT